MSGVEGLRHEHDNLHAGVAAMAAMRDRFEEFDRDMINSAIWCALEFFRYEVGPHACAEELVLYPEVARLLNFHLSDMLIHEHRQIDLLVADLTEAQLALAGGSEVPSKVPDTFTALVNLMRSHLRQEEEVLLTMLGEHLSNAEADALHERMEDATSRELGVARRTTGAASSDSLRQGHRRSLSLSAGSPRVI